tara:strand:- start:16 stop:2670 length:2655 start_codon:yes stop_codon:yes gene_type:complete
MSDLDYLFDDKELDALFDDKELDPLFADEELDALFADEKEEETDYSAFRSATIDFVEAAVGAGDELDATVQLLTGDAANWSEAIDRSRAELRAYEEENPNAAMVTTALGFGAAFFIPGAGIAKIAQTGTKLDRALKVGGLGAAEGAVYGFLSGEGEDRLASAGIGAALGGVLGGASGALLTKNAEEIKEATRKLNSQRTSKGLEFSESGKGSHIGGQDGFVDVGKAKESSRTGISHDTSTSVRGVKDIREGAAVIEPPSGGSTVAGNIFLSTKNWFVSNVGERAAKLAEDSELMIRSDQRAIDEIFDTTFLDAAKMFDDNVAFKALALRMNKSIDKGRRVSWSDFSRVARTPEEKAVVQQLKEQVKTLQGMDFVKQGDIDYFPTKALVGAGQAKRGVLPPEAYDNPIKALKEYAEDISAARALAARFKIDTSKLEPPNKKTGESRLNVVIRAIEKETKKQGATPEVSANLANGLRSQLIASKQGGNTVGSVARRVTSAALLANPMNAVLNIIEGVTAPIYQNGVAAWSKTLPNAILATLNESFAVKNKNWLSNRELGLDKDFMGEVANTGKKAMNDAAESVNFLKVGEKAVGAIDFVNKALYKVSGVQTVNRMGQEILSNSAIQRGITLAKDGSKKSLDKLRQHDGMRGLTEKEFQSTVKALQAKDLSNPWVVNFAGSSMNKWQPVSASTMPKAFHDNPNGRMAYSMLSYMNKQMNSLINDVGQNIMKAKDKGLNTKEGAEAAKEAMFNSAKYAALFGVTAGVWDDFRKTLDLSKDRSLEELMTPEGIASATMNQIFSNVSSGIVNIRAEEYGAMPIEPIPAPISAAARLSSGLFQTGERVLTGEDDPLTPALRATQTYLPGFSNIDRVLRMTTGERLFEDFID